MSGGKIPEKSLVQVSDKIATIHNCERLAGFIGVELAEVDAAREGGKTDPRHLALHILRQWQKSKGKKATFNELSKALTDGNFDDLIEALIQEQERTGNGKTSINYLVVLFILKQTQL